MTGCDGGWQQQRAGPVEEAAVKLYAMLRFLHTRAHVLTSEMFARSHDIYTTRQMENIS